MLLDTPPGHRFDFSWILDARGIDFEGSGVLRRRFLEPFRDQFRKVSKHEFWILEASTWGHLASIWDSWSTNFEYVADIYLHVRLNLRTREALAYLLLAFSEQVVSQLCKAGGRGPPLLE